jgi:hypothetical protein
MKTLLSLAVALVAFAPAHAQIFRPAAVNGALLGGLAGAIIGNNSGSLHHNAWQGAAIGAGAGLLIGSAIDADRRDVWHGAGPAAPRTYVYRNGPAYRGGSVYRSYPYTGGHYYSRPDYRGTGIFWGGLTGAIIGNNSRAFRHDAWRGAAWGAGLGYIFGTIAEDNARYREAVLERPPVYIQSPATPAPAVAQPPQQITIINNYYNSSATPMTSANSLFGRN